MLITAWKWLLCVELNSLRHHWSSVASGRCGFYKPIIYLVLFSGKVKNARQCPLSLAYVRALHSYCFEALMRCNVAVLLHNYLFVIIEQQACKPLMNRHYLKRSLYGPLFRNPDCWYYNVIYNYGTKVLLTELSIYRHLSKIHLDLLCNVM